MREVRLTKGQVAKVDDEDYERVILAGKWCISNRYAYNRTHGGMHRFVMRLPTGTDKRVQVDHINGDPLDNRKENLRVCTPSQNAGNSIHKANRYTQYKGVAWNKATERWTATVKKDGERHYLGVYATDVEAALAYNEAAKRLFGEFARLNDVNASTPPSALRSGPRRRRSKSGYVGVHPYNKKWGAVIYQKGKPQHLGTFETPELAAEARAMALANL